MLKAVASHRTDAFQDCVPILSDMDVYSTIPRLMYWNPESQIGLHTCLGPFALLLCIWHCYTHAIELFF